MDHRDRHHTEKARAVAQELGLDILDADEAKALTPAEWRAWAQLPATRRVIGHLAEGLVASTEAAELAQIKRRNMRGIRPGTGVSNDLAKDQALQSWAAEVYRKLLRGIATEANKE